MANPFNRPRGIFADREDAAGPLVPGINPGLLQREQRQIFVRSYDDLVNALSRLIANYRVNTNINSYLGYEIVIADAIIVPSPIILQPELSGLSITSLGAIPIFPVAGGIVDSLFVIRSAKAIYIHCLNCVHNPRTAAYFRNFVKVESGIVNDPNDSITLFSNNVSALCLYREELGTFHYPSIVLNSITQPEGSDGDIIIHSDYHKVIGNDFGSDEKLFSGEYGRISFNEFWYW